MATKLLNWLYNASTRQLDDVADVFVKKTVKAKTTNDLLWGRLIQTGFTVYDLISGFCEASYLFEVDEKHVTSGMRVISSLMKAIFGYGFMNYIDLFLGIYKVFTEKDPKKDFASALYKALTDNDETLDRAQIEAKLEVEKYNKINGTELTFDEYNKLKNGRWYTKALNWISGKKDQTDDFSKYSISEAEITSALGYGTGAIGYSNIPQSDRTGILSHLSLFSNTSKNIPTDTPSAINSSTHTSLFANTSKDILPNTNMTIDPLSYTSLFIKNNNKTIKPSTPSTKANNQITNDEVNQILVKGYTVNSNGEYNWQNASFYVGMTVEILKKLATADSTLLSRPETSLFAMMYRYYVVEYNYSDKTTITQTKADMISESMNMTMSLGGSGTESEYSYKNGFPFFPTTDERWSDINWRGKTVKTRGSDLASLSMIASAYGGNLIPPNYIYNSWLTEYPQWYNTKGLVESNVFADGGYNAMKATQVKGKRVKVKKIQNPSSIISVLKQRKPVYLTGYRYNGSLFGGTQDQHEIDTGMLDNIGSAVALYANDSYFALNNPYTSINDESVLSTKLLSDKVGPGGTKDVIRSAYVITDPDGKGLPSSINLGALTAPKAKYTPIDEADGWLGMLSAIVGNFTAIGTNLLDSFISGKKYTSIKEVTMSDGEDKIGVSDNPTISYYSEPSLPLSNNGSPVVTTQKSSSKNNVSMLTALPTLKSSNIQPFSLEELAQKYYLGLDYTKKNSTNTWNVVSNTPKPTSKLDSLTYKPLEKNKLPSLQSLAEKYYLGLGYGTGNVDLDIIDEQDAIGTLTKKLETVYTASIGAKMSGESYKDSLNKILSSYKSNTNNSETTDAGSISADISDIDMAQGVDVNGTTHGSLTNFTTTETRNIKKDVPKGYGKVHTYMGWGCITAKSSNQYKLKSQVESYDSNGMGIVGDRFAVAMKPYYGNVGDYLNIVQEDGTMYKVAIADIKGNENASDGNISKYVHGDGSLVEFVVNKNSWYSTSKGGQASNMHANVGTKSFMPELGKNIASITNVGNFWEYDSENKSTPSGYAIMIPSSNIGKATIDTTKTNNTSKNKATTLDLIKSYNLSLLPSANSISSLLPSLDELAKNHKIGLGYGTRSVVGYGSGVTAQNIIDMAASQVGTVETGNNRVKYNTEYYVAPHSDEVITASRF